MLHVGTGTDAPEARRRSEDAGDAGHQQREVSAAQSLPPGWLPPPAAISPSATLHHRLHHHRRRRRPPHRRSDVHAQRASMRKLADAAVAALNPLRAKSRNAMWLSLMLLQLGGVLHCFNDLPPQLVLVQWVALLLILASCLAIVNNVQQFRGMFSAATGSTPMMSWWPKVGGPPPIFSDDIAE